jgi:hypothetical protein
MSLSPARRSEPCSHSLAIEGGCDPEPPGACAVQAAAVADRTGAPA